jgi:stage V sporulation protein B
MARKGIVAGALILTAAGIITRILGFAYRVYMSQVIGAEGLGLYQLIAPVYGLAWSVSCSGFTTTLSKFVSQEKAKGEHGNARRALAQSIVITTGIGIVISILLFVFAETLAARFLNEPRTALSLKILSAAIPFMAPGSCLRGYFLGLQETFVPAVNQVLEQCVRMLAIFLLAGALIPLGLEYACAAVVIGAVAEEFFSLCFIALAYKKHKSGGCHKGPALSNGQVFRLIMPMAIPLTANRVTGSLLAAFENTLIPQRLQAFGLSQRAAISVYGQVSGMAMPLIYFPSAFLVSLSISLVPAVSEARAVKNFERINYTISRSLLFSTVIGFCAAALFVVFAKELGQVIYKHDLTDMLVVFGAMCPFLYMQVVLSGILNGLGFQTFIFQNSLISSAINIAFVYFLVPRWGVNGFIFGWFVSLAVVCALEIEKLRTAVDLRLQFADCFLKPLVSSVAAGILIKYISAEIFFPLCGDMAGLAVSIAVFAGVYLVFIVLTGCVSVEDIQAIRRGAFSKKA